jgi:hypothetical protein
LQNFTVPAVTFTGFVTAAVSVTTVPAATELLGAIVRVVVVDAWLVANSGVAVRQSTRLPITLVRNDCMLLGISFSATHKDRFILIRHTAGSYRRNAI